MVRNAIKKLKYRFVTDIADELISLIPLDVLNHKTIRPYNHKTIIVPVPLHPSRLRERGFNQAEKLGILFAERFDIEIRTDLLEREKHRTAQVEMKDRSRRLSLTIPGTQALVLQAYRLRCLVKTLVSCQRAPSLTSRHSLILLMLR